MSREARLRKLLKNPHVWLPKVGSGAERAFIPSGFEALDQLLGGGWPAGVLTEILLEHEGVGELRLLMPALARLSQLGRDGWEPDCQVGSALGGKQVCWVSPPYIPYAPALQQAGVSLPEMLVVNTESAVDALWAAEQALRSANCAAVLAWFADVEERALRRLQLAAEKRLCLPVVFRHKRFMLQQPAAPLRLHINVSGALLDLEVVRNRYGPVGAISLSC